MGASKRQCARCVLLEVCDCYAPGILDGFLVSGSEHCLGLGYTKKLEIALRPRSRHACWGFELGDVFGPAEVTAAFILKKWECLRYCLP